MPKGKMSFMRSSDCVSFGRYKRVRQTDKKAERLVIQSAMMLRYIARKSSIYQLAREHRRTEGAIRQVISRWNLPTPSRLSLFTLEELLEMHEQHHQKERMVLMVASI